MMIIIMSKVSWENIFMRFQLTFFENKRTFMKKAALHTNTLMHCNARQVLCDLFSTNQENRSDIINYTVMEDLNL